MSDHRCRRADRCHESVKVEQRPVTCPDCACHSSPDAPCDVPGGCGHLHKPTPTKVGGPIMAADGLCPTCTRVVTAAIVELPHDYVELTVAMARGTVGLIELVAATKEPAAPLRVNVSALCQEFVTQAVIWGEPVAEKLRIIWDTNNIEGHTRPGWRLQRATRILAGNIPVLLALRPTPVRDWSDNGWYWTFERDTDPDGIDGALALLQLHHVARAVLGQTKLVHELHAPCPNCDHLTLVRDDGDGFVHCTKCRLQWPETDYQRLTLVVVAEHDGVEPVRPVRPFRVRTATEGTVGRPVPVA